MGSEAPSVAVCWVISRSLVPGRNRMPVVPNSMPDRAGEVNQRVGVREPCGTFQITPWAKSVT